LHRLEEDVVAGIAGDAGSLEAVVIVPVAGLRYRGRAMISELRIDRSADLGLLALALLLPR
jgi:hypothetical protein